MKARRQNPDALLSSGLSLHQQGKVAAAARCFEDILRIDRNNFSAHYYLALTCGQRGQHRKAAELLGRAIAIDPEVPEAHYNRGQALLLLDRFAEAVECFDAAVTLRPGYAAAWFNQGTTLRQLERLDEALAAFDMAVTLTPERPGTHYHRGNILELLQRNEEALAAYDRTLALDPGHGEAWSNRGVVLEALDRSEEALASYDQAVAIMPEDARAWSNRGNTLLALARIDEALASYDEAIAHGADEDPETVSNRSMARLLIGDFAQGLEDWEARKAKKVAIGALSFDKPLWLGAHPLAGKTILVHDEQGLGDTIQFCRYLALLDEQGARVLFGPKRQMFGLLRRLKAEVTLVSLEKELPPFDYHCPMMSLPLAFGTDMTSIPGGVPYLSAEPERVERWAKTIGRGALTIGICWQGNAAAGVRGRSFPLAELHNISKLSGVHLISLHKGAGESQIATLPADMTVETLGPEFDAGKDAFLDTAAVMSCCDMVISSDTAVAHLAGALGVPVWVALKRVPDWRWLLDRSDTPWYPTMRLFRQSAPGNWRSVFEAMEAELKERLGAAG